MDERQQVANVFAIGPANHAGQAWEWAGAVRREFGVDAFSFAYGTLPGFFTGKRSFRFDTDRKIPHHRLTSPTAKRLLVDRLLARANSVALDGFLQVYGHVGTGNYRSEIEQHQRRSRTVSLIAHGSDVRDPDRHIASEEFSYFKSAPESWVGVLRDRSRANRLAAIGSGVPIFVSTPDLLADLPTATWLPLVVRTDLTEASPPVFGRTVPVVLHVPSLRVPAIKGTAFIDPALRRLAREGKIRYLSPERVSHSAMATLLRSADVVVDQIQTGSYGVTAVEAMALNRLVVGNVSTLTASHMRETPPIVNATPENFEAVMRELLNNRDRSAQIANRGSGFVTRWHNGVVSASRLMNQSVRT